MSKEELQVPWLTFLSNYPSPFLFSQSTRRVESPDLLFDNKSTWLTERQRAGVFNLPNMLIEENNKQNPQIYSAISLSLVRKAHVFPVRCFLLLLILSSHKILTAEVAALRKPRTGVCVQAVPGFSKPTQPGTSLAPRSLSPSRSLPCFPTVVL